MIAEALKKIKDSIPNVVTLIAVSKTKPKEMIQEAYDSGHRDFGENKVQELQDKQPALPSDIRWHMIGHLQSNKVKYIAPYIHLVHAVDKVKLAKEISKQALKNDRVIDVLLQVHIAEESSKFGFDYDELRAALSEELLDLEGIRIRGLMGMATFTDDTEQVAREFAGLKKFFDELKTTTFADTPHFDTLSMGMSGDKDIAIEQGSTMVRVGSAIFGSRN